MIAKRPIVPERIRRPPREGWSWIDRRFLREHASRLSGEAVCLYFFLAAVSDRQGLSFYSDCSIASYLRLDVAAVHAARHELLARDLLAYAPPLTQVLALPAPRTRAAAQGVQSIDQVLRGLLHT